MTNTLYFGDNLDVLRNDVRDGSVDLIYLDPPFNSKAQYNVLFRSPRDDRSAQAGAFMDTWTWGDEAEWCYREGMKLGGGVARYIDALRSALGESDMMAYLVMMAVRLAVLHQKLKPTGSLYLHCDPTASHYLKILLDAIFGAGNFRNEVIWKRTSAHNSAKRWGPVHDALLFYTASEKYTWNPVYQPYDESYTSAFYKYTDDSGRRFRVGDLTGAGTRKGESGVAWRGHNPTEKGRHWAPPRKFPGGERVPETVLKALDYLDSIGRIYWPARGGVPGFRRYLDDMEGVQIQDVITDIPPIPSQGIERIGYPTQKPIALLDRIIRASSNEGDLVLDPFCGCGTTVEAAQRADRQWTGIDIAIHAMKVIEARLGENFAKRPKYKIEGIPGDFESAKRLAETNKYQFQWWANYLFNPHALREEKKGMDRGIDGELFFPNGPGRPWGRMLTSVKGGEHVGPAMVREFAGTLRREKAEMGLFICLYRQTKEMVREAAAAGIADTVHGDIPKLQIVAIEDFFEGKFPKLPPLEHLPSAAFSTSRRHAAAALPLIPDPSQPELPLSFIGGKGRKMQGIHFNPVMVRDKREAS
ncbi:MAG: site-specific DNA-methyltransferase [Alphaproteobacteria bacterium]|nr:site-specific DNA-methyltransferase [Alphaproteobacteria bacterium]